MGDSHRRLPLHVQRNLWKVNPKGGTMFEFVTQHQFWPAVVIYWIFSAAVVHARAQFQRQSGLSVGSPRLNQMPSGSKHSMHTRGLAADILCPQFGLPLEVCRQIARSGLAFDQGIHEFGRGATWDSPKTARSGVTNY
ncbi:MAG: hypothetical protein DMG17_27735 [Acidobacteria bacterium]|nr:MAG: hypothetical protein DMG17_27735 [Acidobacteriota bacterium]